MHAHIPCAYMHLQIHTYVYLRPHTCTCTSIPPCPCAHTRHVQSTRTHTPTPAYTCVHTHLACTDLHTDAAFPEHLCTCTRAELQKHNYPSMYTQHAWPSSYARAFTSTCVRAHTPMLPVLHPPGTSPSTSSSVPATKASSPQRAEALCRQSGSAGRLLIKAGC